MIVIIGRITVTLLALSIFFSAYLKGLAILKCINIAIIPISVMVIMGELFLNRIIKKEMILKGQLENGEVDFFDTHEKKLNNLMYVKGATFVLYISGAIGIHIGLKSTDSYITLFIYYVGGISFVGIYLLGLYLRFSSGQNEIDEIVNEKMDQVEAIKEFKRNRKHYKEKEPFFDVSIKQKISAQKDKTDKRLKNLSEREWDDILGDK